jgi:mannose-6-phosphate isomerase
MQLCPLVFEPIFKPKVWGGRNLATLLGKHLPPGADIGESWECADLEGVQSVVARGPAKGRTLHGLIEECGPALYGRTALVEGRFPLLIKFLDAARPLSIQVHPDPQTARSLGADVRSKHEAWYVIHAEAGAVIYRGLRRGVTVETLRRTLSDQPQAVVDCLQSIPVKAGDAYYLPGGTLHALGAGVVVAEVQTPSDVTYRLFDWGRTRPAADAGLHVEQALAYIRAGVDFGPFEKRSHVTGVFCTVTRLITCPSFIVEKVRFVEEYEMDVPYAEPVCWIVLAGRGEIRFADNQLETFSAGEVVLLPAGLEHPKVKALTDCQWLEVSVPVPSDLAAYSRPDRAYLQAPEAPAGGLVQIRIEEGSGKTP